ncbi:hypothetical protein R3P38DRAFT_1182376 [Favolaschia claudopus]|uniref:Uncharacterized protein n=1 Tax=Favolaschia claudopus TaxID=2862362 RepID=A0AAW0E365_9AGAR
MAERAVSPVSFNVPRTTGIRKLATILRPTKMRRTATQPASFSVPGVDVDGRRNASSSPSLYSVSSEDSDLRSKILLDAETSDSVPLLSPTSSTFSSSASEGHGIHLPYRDAKQGVESLSSQETPDARAEADSSLTSSSPVTSLLEPNSTMHRAPRKLLQRITVVDTGHGESFDIDASSMHMTGGPVEPPKSPPLSPSEWIGTNKTKNRVLSVPPEPNDSPLTASSGSSPDTPRPHLLPDNDQMKRGDNLDFESPNLKSLAIPSRIERTRRRPRSASEPRLLLSSLEMSRHAGTVPSTPTDSSYTLFVPPDLNSGPSSSHTITPPTRQSSLPIPLLTMPDDVYFTAAGRRDSRLYLNSTLTSTSNDVPPSPMRRGHTYSNSEPLPDDSSILAPASQYAFWTGRKHSEPTSARPFENMTQLIEPAEEGDSTPVARKEVLWSGNWNRDDIQDVIRQLRSLR